MNYEGVYRAAPGLARVCLQLWPTWQEFFFLQKKNYLNFSYVLINFFQGNSIVIQWHRTKSKPQPVNGGGSQGGELGH